MLDKKLKNRALHRAKIIKGQLEGLIAAVADEEYCTRLLHRSRSIQNSLKSLDRLLLENHLKTHVKNQMKHAGEDERAVRELVEIYTLSNK